MLAPLFLIGVMALAALPGPPSHPTELTGEQTLLRVNQPSEGIAALSVLETRTASGVPERLVVRLDGVPPLFEAPSTTRTQVWLLRTDGTALSRNENWNVVLPPNSREFGFTPVPLEELAGVVVSVNGKLLVREIKATSTP